MTLKYQRDFLKLVYACHPDTKYRHFGDIDAGGFLDSSGTRWIKGEFCGLIV